MSQKSVAEVESQTVEVLQNIGIITGKIKQELKMINELVKEDGALNNSLNNSHTVLCTILEKRGISVDELSSDENSKQTQVLQNISTNVNAITQMITPFMDN